MSNATLKDKRSFWLAGFLGFGLFLFWLPDSLAFDPAASTEFTMNQESSYCLACHDKVPVSPLHRSHPQDLDYLSAQLRSAGKLRPPALLDPAVYLKDGKMVCTSCHHPESQHPAKLSVSNVGSKLCLSCHNL